MKPLTLTPAAARWLHQLVHTPGLGVRVEDLAAADQAVGAIDAAVAELPLERPPAPANGAEAPARGRTR